jgi:hypothetical protein
MNRIQLLKRIIKIAENQKLAGTPTTSAQPSDVEAALKNANLWELSKQVSPLLNQAGVPDDAAVAINIIADKGGLVKYIPTINPPNPNVSNKLGSLLMKQYSASMSKALQVSNLNIESPLTLNWLKY